MENVALAPVGDPEEINHVGLGGNHDWLCCKVENNRFEGAGGPASLIRICDVFMNWARR